MHRDSIATFVAEAGAGGGQDMDSKARGQLVALLRDAARLEHCLLNAYLYTACSLKSRPEEFATLPNGRGEPVENLRRALQFELARDWKNHMLDVAKEEMLHLHYVNCLLRALGERPEFGLPTRGAEHQGGWFIPDWQPIVGGKAQEGVPIPIEGLTEANARRFVVYESTDALQYSDLFNSQMLVRFEQLRDWELKFRIEIILHNESKKEQSQEQQAHLEALREELRRLYDALPPTKEPVARVGLEAFATAPEEKPQVKFRSIADFYNRAILPLYQQAYDFGWVKDYNRDLNNELRGAAAAEGFFLKVGPVNRGKNFEATATKNKQDPLRDYKRVEDVIREIVEEGEGFSEFERLAGKLLERSPREYLEALLIERGLAQPKDKTKKGSPEWLAHGERLRKSHLYRFALVLAERAHEAELCKRADLEFSASRVPVDLGGNLALRQLAQELPAQFNACYVVVCAWLSRLYETQDWLAGKPRRLSIEMLATWPLMSLAIRPFLELASFLGPEVHAQLFRQDEGGLAQAPTHAVQLLRLFQADARSEEICARMDYLAVRALEDVAIWAQQQIPTVEQGVQDPLAREMMVTRLKGLSNLGEFKKQFSFRVHGGYSGQAPDLTYLQDHPEGAHYEEDPTGQIAKLYTPGAPDQEDPLFTNTLVLRLRFQGWGRVQLATDPDPPTDEVGCSGTQMLHAADAPAAFDRSLFWQPHEGAIVRGPRTKTGGGAGDLPDLGVQCVSVSLLATDKAVAAYTPYGTMNSTGAVQTSGVQADLTLSGLTPLLSLTPEEILGAGKQIRIDLKPRHDGRRPYLVGENHLIWRDGEPIDPFILAISCDGLGDKGELSREVFNEGKELLHFSPLQRLMSRRAPTGFVDGIANVPEWVTLPSSLRQAMQQPGFPMPYLEARANVLTGTLAERLHSWGETPSQKQVDEVVSFAERARRFNLPRGTTIGWLDVSLHYSHTVSGKLNLPGKTGRDLPLLQAIERATNLDLRVRGALSDRNAPNARWLAQYTLGAMDTDALANFIYGEVYVPLAIEQATSSGSGPITLTRRWSLAPGLQEAVKAYACDFARPFWADFQIDGKGTQRKITLPDGTELTETLQKSDASGYSYALTGLPSVSSYEGQFEVRQGDKGATELVWTTRFQPKSAEGVMPVVLIIAGAGQAMGAALRSHFSPREAGTGG